MQTTNSQREKARRRPPPNYFSRREQYRLFVLVSMLMLIVLMMNEARKPQTWAWMWAGEQNVAQDVVPDEELVDTRVAPAVERQLPADGFVAMSPNPAPPESQLAALSDLPGLTSELLAMLEDDTVMRSAETETWRAAFAALKSIPQHELDAKSIGKVGFVQLFRQTDFYRGKLVTISGIVQRLEKILAKPNQIGVEKYYRWILDPQSGANAPIVVYSLEKPSQLSLGDHLREYVEVTGVCYKRWAYLAGDGTRVAPLLLAKNASWQPPREGPATWSPSNLAVLISALGLAVVSIMFATRVLHASSYVSPEVKRIRAANRRGIEEIDNRQVLPNVEVALHQLAEQDEMGEQR